MREVFEHAMSPMRRLARAESERRRREAWEAEKRAASDRGEPDGYLVTVRTPWPQPRGVFALMGLRELEPTGDVDDQREREALMADSVPA